jgi:hypothetical protein
VALLNLTNALPARPWPALALLLLLGAARPAARAQSVLTNNGGTLFVNTGGTLQVNGHLSQTGTALLRTPGTTTVRGNVASATGTTLDLSTGLLDVTGNISAATGTTTATTGTLRLAGPTNQTVSLNGGTVGQLLVNKTTAGGTRLDLPTDLVAATGVTLTAGLVRTAANATLVLPAGATLTGEGSGQYVQGNLRVSRTVTGTAPVDFGNGLVLDPAGQNLGTATATRTAGLQTAGVSYGQNLAGSTKGIDRVWRVAATQAPTAPVTVTLRWPADDDNGFVPGTNARLWRAAQPNGPWNAEGQPASASARSFTASTSQLGVLTVSNVGQPLPVELLEFTAEAADGAALLRWATASEKNSAYFAVEASSNGRDFREISRQAAQGTSPQRHAYRFTDANLARYTATQVYYRLRQADLDGTFSYSPVRTVTVGPAQLALFPNPAHGTATLIGAVPGQLVQVFDALGRPVATLTADATGTAALVLPDGRTAGLYIVRTGSSSLRLTVE